MGIELAKLIGARHTVKVSLKFEDVDTTATEQIRIIYRGISLAEAAARETAINTSTDLKTTLSEQLATIVLELPDLIDNGQPVQPTAEFFQALDMYFVRRISQAITDDQQGNG